MSDEFRETKFKEEIKENKGRGAKMKIVL